jgi:threonine/homoserine/homoserine lactone efflux protein
MPDASALAAFALTALLIELTPGPNMAWLTILAAVEGRRTGLAAVAGVALGLALVGLAAAAGVAAIVSASPPLYQALRWGGAAFLLYLAWDGWRTAAAPDGAQAAVPPAVAFRRGLVTNLLNPKAAVFYVAVMPEFLPPAAGPQAAIVLAAIYVAVATVVHAGIVVAAGTARVLLENPVRERVVRRIFALLLVAVALWLLARG